MTFQLLSLYCIALIRSIHKWTCISAYNEQLYNFVVLVQYTETVQSSEGWVRVRVNMDSATWIQGYITNYRYRPTKSSYRYMLYFLFLLSVIHILLVYVWPTICSSGWSTCIRCSAYMPDDIKIVLIITFR